MTRSLIGAAALALCLWSAAASAQALWKGDFSTGDLSQWNVHQFRNERIRTVTRSDLPLGASHAAEVTVVPGDWNNGGNRNELVHFVYEPEGSESYYRWQTLFPTDYPSRNTWQVFTQWHSRVNTGVPPVQFFVNGETLFFSIQSDQRVLYQTPLQRGAWQDFILHVKFSDNPSVGFVELWHNGQRVVPPTFGRTQADTYLKQGLYRNSNIDVPATVFHTGMVQGRTAGDVAPPGCTSWLGDFSGGDLSQWTRLQAAAPDRFALATPPVPAPQGLRAARVTVQPQDLVSGGNRSQLVHLQDAYEGSEYFYRWHTLLPADYASVGVAQTLLSLNRRDDVAGPPVLVRTQGEELQVVFNDNVVYRGPLRRGRWESMTLQVKYSDAGAGHVAFYRDDRRVLAPLGGVTHTRNYLKFGLNRTGTLATPTTVYVAGMRQGCSLAQAGVRALFDNHFE